MAYNERAFFLCKEPTVCKVALSWRIEKGDYFTVRVVDVDKDENFEEPLKRNGQHSVCKQYLNLKLTLHLMYRLFLKKI